MIVFVQFPVCLLPGEPVVAVRVEVPHSHILLVRPTHHKQLVEISTVDPIQLPTQDLEPLTIKKIKNYLTASTACSIALINTC